MVSYGRTVSFGIQRRQFDDYLLRRAGVRLQLGQPVRSLVRSGPDWIINGTFQAPLLVAAGGHFCPVARLLASGAAGARDGRDPVVIGEEFEIELSPSQQARCTVDPLVPEIYFCDDLLGYGVPSKGPLLNVGLGVKIATTGASMLKNSSTSSSVKEASPATCRASSADTPISCTIIPAPVGGRRGAMDRRRRRPGPHAKRRRDRPGNRVGPVGGRGRAGGPGRFQRARLAFMRGDRGPLWSAA